MKGLLLIFLGGGTGSVFRYLLSRIINNLDFLKFPMGILSVNILSCFLSGLLIGLLSANRLGDGHYFRLLFIVGFCGGFSTFSGYSDQIIRFFFNENKPIIAIADILLSNVFCFIATYIGLMLIEKFK